MKKIICAVLALIITIAAASVAVCAADKPEKLLLLGDSITYGYGLEGDRDTCASYGNKLRDYLGISSANFKNAAVNGDTSADLLALLPSLEQDIKDADMIVITIGGNDLLGLIWEAGAAVLGDAFSSYASLLDILADPTKLIKLAEQLTTEKISSAIVNYTTNLAAIMSYIRSNNANARVLLLAQYDPMSGVEGLEPISTLANTAINMLNAVMKAQAATGACTYIDVYTPFVGMAVGWTNIMMADIHPNYLGHDKIFNIIKDSLEYEPAETTSVEEETTTPTPVDTTTPVPLETTTPHEPVITPAPDTDDTTIPDGAETTTEPVGTTAEQGDAPAAVTTVPDISESDEQGGCGGSLAAVSLMAALTLGGIMLSCKNN